VVSPHWPAANGAPLRPPLYPFRGWGAQMGSPPCYGPGTPRTAERGTYVEINSALRKATPLRYCYLGNFQRIVHK
jgi:hypothetical protein